MHGLWTLQVSLTNGGNWNRKETLCRHACKSLLLLIKLIYVKCILVLILFSTVYNCIIGMQQQVHVLMAYSSYVVEEMPVVWYVNFDPKYAYAVTFSLLLLLVDAFSLHFK